MPKIAIIYKNILSQKFVLKFIENICNKKSRFGILFVKFLMSFFEFWIRYMSIHLRCSNRRMSEKFLNNSDIRTIGQKCRRKTMT